MRQNLRDAESSSQGADPEGAREFYRTSWAVVIGINGYKSFNPLRFAVADAVGMAETLITKLGFPHKNVFLIVDPPSKVPERYRSWLTKNKSKLGAYKTTATRRVIDNLLFTVLPERARPDDRVLVYFAGHGTSRRLPDGDPHKATPYLVPVDGKRGQWLTHIDLNNLLREGTFLQAKHVFYLLDACCSGLAEPRMDDAETRYKQDLLQRRARQCLTAGTAEQPVDDRYEDDPTLGHSIFTWNVLQVLGGGVNLDEGLVTASNLTAYVKQKVGKKQGRRQTPNGFTIAGHDGGEFIFSAPRVALTFDERARLARLLMDELGNRLDDASPVAFAATLWQKITGDKLSDATQEVQALRERARALLALNRIAEARRLLSDSRLATDSDAKLLRGIAHMKGKQGRTAAELLSSFATDHPEHEYSSWAKHAAAIVHRTKGQRRALLIGVGKYKNLALQLGGCKNDVRALDQVLRSNLEFDEVSILLDEEATAAAIKAELSRLAAVSKPDDSFVCYIAGNGTLASGETVFVSYDFDRTTQTWVTELEIDTLMRSVPAQDKLLVTDACHLTGRNWKSDSGYRYLSGERLNDKTLEIAIQNVGVHGAFTYALVNALRTLGNVSIMELLKRIKAELSSRRLTQTPGCRGNLELHFIRRPPVIDIVELAEGRPCSRFSVEQIKAYAAWLQGNEISSSPLWLNIGRSLLAKKDYIEAAKALQQANSPAAALPLARSQLMLELYAEAARNMRTFDRGQNAGIRDDESKQCITALSALLRQIGTVARHALFLWVPTETSQTWTSNPAELLNRARDALLTRGFIDKNVKVARVTDRDDLLSAFHDFVARAGEEPAFFLFLGPGFEDTEIWISSSGETASANVSLLELRESARGCPNLTSAILITQTRGPRDWRPSTAHSDEQLLGLGAVTLVATPARHRDISLEDEEDAANRESPPNVPLLLDSLLTMTMPALTVKDVLHTTRLPEATFRGDATYPLFSYQTVRKQALELLRNIESAALRIASELLTKLLADRTLAAFAWLHRGLILGELGQHQQARHDIDTAMSRYRADHARKGIDVDEVPGIVRWPEAHYHRGRILLEEGRYAEAEAALAIAVRQNHEFAAAYYHRARAIQCLIETDLEKEVRVSVQRYVALGAPLGLDDDIKSLFSQDSIH